MKTTTKLWMGVGILGLLSPLGLILPEKFKARDAWGEWSLETVKGLMGYIPEGLEKLGSLWTAPMPDYAFKGSVNSGMGHLSLAYIFSAVLGMGVTVLIVFYLGKWLVRK